MKTFYPEYLFKDAPNTEDAANDQLDLMVDGCHVYGTLYYPASVFEGPRPIVVFFHGFPGTTHMDDVILALRRCGCVVMTVYHRGAWGSDGKYLVSHCVEDAAAVLDYIRSDVFTQAYRTDPDHIYFIGHSMGGNTVINAAKNHKGIKGLILFAPYDPTLPARSGKTELLYELLPIGLVMHTDGVEAMAKDIFNHPEFEFVQAVDALRDTDICLLTGSLDEVASYNDQDRVFWETLTALPSDALHRKKEYYSGHGFENVRMELAEDVAAFIAESLKA
jgi:pimeloyl-ACP methyl ester carboxylesterase